MKQIPRSAKKGRAGEIIASRAAWQQGSSKSGKQGTQNREAASEQASIAAKQIQLRKRVQLSLRWA
jgi:hypothetical protein